MERSTRIPIIAFILGILFFPLMAWLIPGIGRYPDVMVFAGIYSLIALGLTILMGFAGQVSLGHAAFFGIGAYSSAIGTVNYSLNPWFCLLIGVILSSCVAIIVGTPSLKLRGHYLAMATLAFGVIVSIIFNQEVKLTGGPDGMGRIPTIALFTFNFNTILRYYYLVWFTVFGALWFCMNILNSRVGRAFRSIHASEVAAGAIGVNVSSFKIQAFILSVVLASIAGSLYAHYLKFVNPSTFDLLFSIKLLIMITVGGIHSIWGAIIGVLIVTFLSNEWLFALKEFEIFVYGGVLLLIVIFLPDGLVSIPKNIRLLLAKKLN